MKYRTALPFFPKNDIDDILKEYREILEGKGLFTKGPQVKRFERSFSNYVGTKYGVAVNSGTSALELCLKAIGVGEGDEVIVPIQTFVSTGSCVVNNKAKPVFCGIDENHLMNIEDLKSKITSSTKAVIIVHFCGLIHPKIKDLKNFLHNRDIVLIEDAAHAHGARIDKLYAGSIGDFGCFSFYSTKIITTAGEGGFVTTNNSDYFDAVSSLSAIGINKKSSEEIYNLSGSNNRMTEFQAIAGLYQLKRLDEFVSHRNFIAKIYISKLQDLIRKNIIKPQFSATNIRHSYWRFLVNIKDKNISRYDIKDKMRKYGIIVDWPYAPLMHLQPVFHKQNRNSFPKSELIAEQHLCLPMHFDIKEKDAIYIADKFIFCINNF